MKPIVAIFAHPDDETFGPGGFLALQAQKRDVYLICVTDGAAGKNSSQTNENNLSLLRKKELTNASRILGIKKVFFFSYSDGTLSNNLYHEIAKNIKDTIRKIEPEILVTFEPHGISGHIDHIAISLITTFVFEKIDSIKKLLYFCMSKAESKEIGKNYFIHFPEGYSKNEIDLVVDVSSVWEKRINALLAHESQKHDSKKLIHYLSKKPKNEFFLVKERK